MDKTMQNLTLVERERITDSVPEAAPTEKDKSKL
jgi:hypothetical protein